MSVDGDSQHRGGGRDEISLSEEDAADNYDDYGSGAPSNTGGSDIDNNDDAADDGISDDDRSDASQDEYEDEDYMDHVMDEEWWENIGSEELTEIKELVAVLERAIGKNVLDQFSFVEIFGSGGDEDEDADICFWEDLDFFRALLEDMRKKRRPKYHQQRKDIDQQSFVLLTTSLFERRFRMPKEHLDYLVDALREDIAIDQKKSKNSTKGETAPINSEQVVRCGIDRLAHCTSELILQDLYGMSLTSTKRIFDLFLDAVDKNTTCPELQVQLPDPTNNDELDHLAKRWCNASTVYKLFDGFLGALDGWLPRTEMPRGVTNQVDYFSGHYQCYGLNVQAMCDPDLVFLYCAVAAPGKVNDIRAFLRCDGLQHWIRSLPEEYYIGADNAYPLSRKVLIPFSGPELTSEAKRTYNFYLSQLRIRIEMAFGRLTTKWRILRSTLACLPSKNAKIIRVCMKLHNFCIRMEQKDGDGRVGVIETAEINPSNFDINPLGGSPFGFYETGRDDEECDGEFDNGLDMGHESGATIVNPSSDPPNNYGAYTNSSLRDELVDDIVDRRLPRPNYNRRRNRDWEWDDDKSIDSSDYDDGEEDQ